MSAGVVVDSWPILAFLQGEAPADVAFARLLRRAAAGNLRLLLSWINLGEVYYRLIQLGGRARADERLADLRRLPFELVPVREALVLEAGRLKGEHRISYADAFAVATARLARLPLLTGDPEILELPSTVVRVRRLERGAGPSAAPGRRRPGGGPPGPARPPR